MERLFWNLKGFQWDEGNRDKNWISHKVHYTESEQAFFNRPILLFSDDKHSITENRYALLGVADNGRKLTIVFTVRGELARVISARDMDRKERMYYEQITEKDSSF